MKCGVLYALLLVPFAIALPTPQATTENLVVVTESTTLNDDIESTTTLSTKELENLRPPTITALDVNSNVTNRFAKSSVRSKVKNEAPISQETTFVIVIPDQAFISSFVMEIGGKNYTAYVQEKEKAKKTYDEAVLSGIGAAHVAVSARDSNKFTVSVNIEPQSKAIFYLVYEELLERKDGLYELVVNIHPNQLVKHMHVQVDIMESRPITTVKTPPIRSGNEIAKESPNLEPNADIKQLAPEHAQVHFSPDYAQQKQIAQGLGKEEKDGIGGQFVVQYDVERDPRGGEVLVKDGYFVHFFAPSELQPLDKHVVFVLDTSGSMYNRKMDQLKTAMHNILGELKPTDSFNLVEFNTNVKVWNLDAPLESTHFPSTVDNWYRGSQVFDLTDVSFPPAYPVNKNTIKKANKAVEDMYATGGTNIYEALRVGLHLIKLRQTRTGDKNAQPLIVFLTDGDPTVGKTGLTEIIGGISELNLAKVPIVSLSFGTGADRDFLQKISLKNTGFARHIYEDSDASLQLQNFYRQISSPLLRDIKFEYTPDVNSLTRNEFPILYGGSEIVVCGKYPGNEFNKEASKVVSWGRNGPINLLPSITKATGQLERLWAYMTVKKYLDAKDVAEGNTTEYEEKALAMALKYSFVTPVTSLVVVKPNATSAVNAEAADRNNDYPSYLSASSFPVAGLRRVAAHRPLIVGGPVRHFMHKQASPSLSNRATGFAIMPMQPQYSLGAAGGFSGGGGGSVNYAAAPMPPVFDSDAVQPDAAVYHKVAFASTTVTFAQSEASEEVIAEAVTSTTTETPSVVTLPPAFDTKLPWLKDQVAPDGTLKFLKGNYQLGFNETSPVDEECTDPRSRDGLCVLLKDCEEIYPELTSPKTFKDYFCALDNNLVGVCCSKKKKPEQP